MKLRTVIVDDERMARTRLRRMLEKDPEVEIVAECEDGLAAVAVVQEQEPDLLLLDIQMPEMDGFGVLDALGPERTPEVVFVTAYDEHAIRAFDEHALDYLMKPVAPERFTKMLARVRERRGKAKQDSLFEMLAQRKADNRAARLMVKNGERTSFIAPEEIDWVEAAGNYAILHLGKRTHILRETMSALETQLVGDVFCRVSRSAILNLRRVRELQSVSPGEHVAILTDGQRIGISRSLREVEEKLRHV
ncbi:MAG TPA: LytTR family DNA-binding domain-containing protein [Chthoniobacteraceae bacterium]|jgi:two-component system LytT family response regulator|nr:LytTR family DNA-binding domain-containing protein [Chthoniobacteraceae bacterium]